MPAAVAVGLLVLVWAATSGPSTIIGSSGRRIHRDHPTPTATAGATQVPGAHEKFMKNHPPSHHLAWVGDLLAWAVVLLALGLLALALHWLWRNRWRRPPEPESAAFDVLPDVDAVAEALSRDAGAQLAAVAEGSPRNGIVRCWLRMEEVTAEAGLPREEWETSAEFTVRVLRTLDLDPRGVGTLARLYREARFSDHELGEDARQAARAALQRLHSDLLELGVAVSATLDQP